MAQALVTIGTDGPVNFVKLPNGVRQSLGIVSPVKFVVELVPRAFTARAALDEFLANGHAMLRVDLDAMWKLLKPRKSRWGASTSPFMDGPDRTTTDQTPLIREGASMADDSAQRGAITNQVAQIEKQISLLQRHVKEAGPGSISKSTMEEQISSLRGMIADLRAPSPYGNQSQNSDFYPKPKSASYDSFQEHSELAETIISRVASTNEKIDKLVEAGKKFDSPRAKLDLHKIASRVTDIAADVDLAQPWIGDDLRKLATEADRIHGLFEPVEP